MDVAVPDRGAGLVRAASWCLRAALPVECTVCGRVSSVLCPECARGFDVDPVIRRLEPTTARFVTTDDPTGTIRSVIRVVKDHERFAVLPALRVHAARLIRLASRSLSVDADGDLWVALPSSRQRHRGFSVVALAVRGSGVRLHQRAIHVVRAVRDQRGLDASARRRNLLGALAADPRIVAGRRTVLVDDVLTTGATLQACVQAIGEAGGAVAGAVVFARVPRAVESHPVTPVQTVRTEALPLRSHPPAA